MANVRQAIESNPQNTALGKLYAKSYDAALAKVPKDLVPAVKREFHAIFTFAFVMPLQLFYLWYILSGNTLENGFGFISLHFHLTVTLLGAAALRCLVGYLINGKIMEQGACYDYITTGTPGGAGGAGANGSQKTGTKSSGKQNLHSSPELK